MGEDGSLEHVGERGVRAQLTCIDCSKAPRSENACKHRAWQPKRDRPDVTGVMASRCADGRRYEAGALLCASNLVHVLDTPRLYIVVTNSSAAVSPVLGQSFKDNPRCIYGGSSLGCVGP